MVLQGLSIDFHFGVIVFRKKLFFVFFVFILYFLYFLDFLYFCIYVILQFYVSRWLQLHISVLLNFRPQRNTLTELKPTPTRLAGLTKI